MTNQLPFLNIDKIDIMIENEKMSLLISIKYSRKIIDCILLKIAPKNFTIILDKILPLRLMKNRSLNLSVSHLATQPKGPRFWQEMLTLLYIWEANIVKASAEDQMDWLIKRLDKSIISAQKFFQTMRMIYWVNIFSHRIDG